MQHEFRLPDIGEGIAEAEIVAWHVAVGDLVEEDAPLADVMTDKATVELSSPLSGRVVRLAGDVGDRIPIGSMFVLFDTEGDESGAGGGGEPESSPPPPADAEPSDRQTLESEPTDPATDDSPLLPPKAVPAMQRASASPAVRQRARDLGVDLAEVSPADGLRVRHSDLDAYLRYSRAQGFGVPATSRPDETIRVVGLRRRIAENMAAAKRSIPHFSYVEEIDVTRLEDVRAQLNAARTDGQRLTILPLLIAAICRALPEFPMLNARYDDEAGIVVRHGAVHLGVATQTPQGLMVPVVRDAQARNVWQLATEIARLAEACRKGTIRPEELSGSTITITSLGPLGGLATTPVINRPEVAIIGPNKVIERPVVRDGSIVVAKMMNLSISCDHRVVDGWDAASYVQALKRLVESPALIFAP